MWIGILGLYFVLTKLCQVQIIYRFTWKYIICLICVHLKFFCKLAIRKIFMSSLFSPVKKRNNLCEIKRKGYRSGLLLTWVPVWDSAHQVHSRVSNVNFVLCGRGRGSRNIACMPRCRFIVLNMHLR